MRQNSIFSGRKFVQRGKKLAMRAGKQRMKRKRNRLGGTLVTNRFF